nr:winged helix-turn-helix transcriptional regulator [Streptomyces agglomeratus]
MRRDGSPDREAGASSGLYPGVDLRAREGPTVREIGHRVGLSSTSSVQYQLKRLEQQGVISRSGSRWRSYRLT